LGRPNEILIQVKEESALVLNRVGGLYQAAMSEAAEKEVRKKLQNYTTRATEQGAGAGLFKWVRKQLGQEAIADESLFDSDTGSDEVSLVSMTIMSVTREVGGVPSEKPAISVQSGHLRLEKCEIKCENGNGIILEGENAELTARESRLMNIKGTGLLLRTRAKATLSRTSIIKCKESGIDGQGYTSVRLMECEISNNQRTGVQVSFKSQLIAYQTVFSGNSFEGIWMNNQSHGTVKGCDMRGNARGPNDISSDCRVEMSGNKP
jgi:hypothetical protein